MEGIQLYNKDKQEIYPISKAEAILTEASGESSNVEECLADLYRRTTPEGDIEATNNIKVKIQYCRTDTKEESEVKEKDNWQDFFSLPNQENPYVWKKTSFSYSGESQEDQDLKTTYEIVASDTAQIIQNIYIARSTGKAPIIEYPKVTGPDGEPTEEDDLSAFDNSLPEGWSETPVSVSPATPYVFMSTRKRVDGQWERYSEPAQFGRWAFDSQLELRYTVTSSEVPSVDKSNDNPGEQWTTNAQDDFTGKLWMITATSVNGVLNKDDNGNKWFGPHLIAKIQ